MTFNTLQIDCNNTIGINAEQSVLYAHNLGNLQDDSLGVGSPWGVAAGEIEAAAGGFDASGEILEPFRGLGPCGELAVV